MISNYHVRWNGREEVHDDGLLLSEIRKSLKSAVPTAPGRVKNPCFVVVDDK
jgi:hypothetical protein